MENRKYIIGFIVLMISFVFLGRLFYIQVVSDTYELDSRNNVLRYITEHPARGLIFDRNRELLVYNQAAYDLYVVPRQLDSLDTNRLLELVNLSKPVLIERINEARRYSSRKPSVIATNLTSENYALLQEELYRFKGFFTETKTLRKYPVQSAAHLLGYVSEVDQRIIASNPYYKMRDQIGRSGIEKQYEEELRGKRGMRIVMVDVFNREKGKFREGQYDTASVSGNELHLTIDAELQKYGETLMQNKKGSIVALDPTTGEILALISKPDWDPNMLVGRVRSSNYRALEQDTLKPLFNRALMASYPPGSTFKLINALIGLQIGVLYPNTLYSCNHGYHVRGLSMGCHAHRSPVNLEYSIQTSCNAYYSNVFRSIIDHYPSAEQGFDAWRTYIRQFGLGSVLEIDLPGELTGNVPTKEYYDRYYRKGGWNSLTIVSLAIGQGELGITPLQMANISATIANRGHYYTPHVLRGKKIMHGGNQQRELERHDIEIDQSYFDLVADAMEKVVNEGTGRSARKDGIAICGKTGTVENPHGDDHSTFLAFAPKDDPKIAISVYVENGVWGSRWAAPIAGLMIEKYLTDSTANPALEERMIQGNLLASNEGE